jgi:flavin reductase (DIM6/NTAB) family NADH-FMN oxidoreductase RutF
MKKIRVNFKKMYYGFPVILISYFDENGVPNVTTLSSSYTLGNMVLLGFGSKSYAVNNIKKVKDFVINIPDRSLMKEIDFCGYSTGRNCKKFDFTNLTPVKSDKINAPTIAECPISIECTLTDIVENENFPNITNVLAEIKGRIISENLLSHDQQLDYASVDTVLYVGDDKNKMYRYTDKLKADFSKSFIE